MHFKGSEEYKRLPVGLDVNIRVLTSGFWPSYPVVDLTLPEGISRCARNASPAVDELSFDIDLALWGFSHMSCSTV